MKKILSLSLLLLSLAACVPAFATDPRPDIKINFTRSSAAATFARPNNTTTYTAGGVVSTASGVILEFPDCVRATGGAGAVRSVILKKSRTGITAAIFRLHLLTVSPTAIGDNGGWQLLWANRATHVGYVDLTMTSERGTDGTPTAIAVTNLPYVCADTDTKLYGVLCVEDAYSPYALEEFYVKLIVEAF